MFMNKNSDNIEELEITRHLISVIIPYYKGDRYIDQCLESLLSQTIGDIEILIVVDEKDREGEERLKKRGFSNKVKVISGGNDVSANRNIGLNHAEGRYVFFMDADDFLLRNDVFETMLRGIEENQADMAIGEFDGYFDDRGEFVEGARFQDSTPPIPNILDVLRIRYATHCLFVDVWNALFKRELIGEERFDEALVVAEDGTFMLDILKKHPCIYVCKGLVSYGYRRGQSSNSNSKPFAKRVRCVMKMWDADKMLVEQEFPELKDIMYRGYLVLMRECITTICIRSSKKDGTINEGKNLYKEFRKKYFLARKEAGKHAPRNRSLWEWLLRVNLLWSVYRLKLAIKK